MCIACVVCIWLYRNRKKYERKISKLTTYIKNQQIMKQSKEQPSCRVVKSMELEKMNHINYQHDHDKHKILYQYAVASHSTDSISRNNSGPSQRNSFSNQQGIQNMTDNLSMVPVLRLGYQGMTTSSKSGSDVSHPQNVIYSKGSLSELRRHHSAESNNSCNEILNQIMVMAFDQT